MPRSNLVFAARRVLAAHRALRASFPPGFSHDPILEILCRLYVAQAEEAPVSESRLVRAIGIGPMAAGRWIAVLAHEGLVTIEKAPDESRDTRIMLSRQGEARTRDVLHAVIASQRGSLAAWDS